ncbi:MAG: type II toxin-antitoxin system HicB family antitoxin [Alphaproteobacteria bacterium]|nr:type II toxin-antitoxin system HicB family antitoxin [Alphaproteobacteria bacterium]
MIRKTKFSATVRREGKWYVAQCLEVDVASQGRSQATALKNLSDALALHFTPPIATRVPKIMPVEVKLRAA